MNHQTTTTTTRNNTNGVVELSSDDVCGIEAGIVCSSESKKEEAAVEETEEESSSTSASAQSSSPSSNNTTSKEGGCPRYSLVSAKYDKNNKGYLDETELALRKMDSQNLGYLNVEKIYDIMHSLQLEQRKYAELMDALQKQQRKSLSLKRAVIALCVFAVLLALANVGTSFAAASLAKDTSVPVDTNDLVVKGTNLRVATTSKLVEVVMEPVDIMSNNNETLRRLLWSSNQQRRLPQICGEEWSYGGGNGNSAAGDWSVNNEGTTCRLQGLIDYNQALEIYQQFCPGWSPDNPTSSSCGGGGVSTLTLKCRQSSSTLFGQPRLPAGPPTVDEDYVTFPRRKRGYKGLQMIEPSNPSLGKEDCEQQFSVGMDCPRNSDDGPCLVFASWNSTCDKPVEICGPNGAY